MMKLFLVKKHLKYASDLIFQIIKNTENSVHNNIYQLWAKM